MEIEKKKENKNIFDTLTKNQIQIRNKKSKEKLQK